MPSESRMNLFPFAKPNICHAGVSYFNTTDFHMRKRSCLAPSLAAVYKLGKQISTTLQNRSFCYAVDLCVKGLSVEGNISYHYLSSRLMSWTVSWYCNWTAEKEMILSESLREELWVITVFGRDGKQLLHLNVNDTRTVLFYSTQGPYIVTLTSNDNRNLRTNCLVILILICNHIRKQDQKKISSSFLRILFSSLNAHVTQSIEVIYASYY